MSLHPEVARHNRNTERAKKATVIKRPPPELDPLKKLTTRAYQVYEDEGGEWAVIGPNIDEQVGTEADAERWAELLRVAYLTGGAYAFQCASMNIELAERRTVHGLWDALADWSRKTFGSDAKRGPVGPLKHLASEVEEAIAAPQDLVEYADCLMLLFDAARRAGFNLDALLHAANEKLIVNKGRKWPTPRDDEPTRHVEDAT